MIVLALIVLLLCNFASNDAAKEFCEQDMYEANFYNASIHLRTLVIWFPVAVGSKNKLNMCSLSNGEPVQRNCYRNGSGVDWEEIKNFDQDLLFCSSINNNCHPEPFEHKYLMKNNISKAHTNYWPAGRIGDVVGSQEPCLLQNGQLLTRACEYNVQLIQSEWMPGSFGNITCLHDVENKIITQDLYKLNNEVEMKNGKLSDAYALKTTTRLCDILENENTYRIPADFQISTNILQTVVENHKPAELLPNILKIANNLMNSSDIVIRDSVKSGTSNILLKTVETYFDSVTETAVPTSKCDRIPNGVLIKSEGLLTVFYINALCSNVSGIAVYNRHVRPSLKMMYDAQSESYYRYLYMNQSIDDLIQEDNVEAAVHLPEILWNSNDKLSTVKISLYRRNALFARYNYQPKSVVLKVTVPEYVELPGNVSLIFRDHQTEKETRSLNGYENQRHCGQWNYEWWDYGRNGGSALVNFNDLVLCQTTNTVWFGALVGLDTKPTFSSDNIVLRVLMGYTLDVISIVGCCLSLFGLICIWITAICCRKWRLQASNKLLLNMCLVLTLLMAYFLFINLPDARDGIVNLTNPNTCIAEGAFLQYIILVLFLWMFFLAILQYQRYIVVIGVQKPQYYILKYALAAWGLPVIPTALVLYFDSNSYLPLSTGFNENASICYPKGLSFNLSLLLPISIISIANSAIFIYILVSVQRSLTKFRSKKDRNMIYKQLRLSILLFFLLGISWLFGLLAHLDQSGVLAFLFCITATLQGFVLFIYFVVIDDNVKFSWMVFYCGGREYVLTENQSSQYTSSTAMQK